VLTNTCHYHGGKTPIKHGLRTSKTIIDRGEVSRLINDSNALIDGID